MSIGSRLLASDDLDIRARAVRDGLIFAGLLLTGFAVALQLPAAWHGDAAYYWDTPLRDLYVGWYPSAPHGHPYSPAFAQLMGPFQLLPFPIARLIWFAIAMGALLWLASFVRPSWRVPFILLCLFEAINGNIHLLMASALALSLRFPATWAFILLTKITPGVGLIWFVVRREWRSLGLVIAATLAIAAISYAIVPDLWARWVAMLWAERGAPTAVALGQVPLVPRIVVSAAVVGWGARTDRPWTIPVAATIALPNFVLQGLTVLAAIPALVHGRPIAATGSVTPTISTVGGSSGTTFP